MTTIRNRVDWATDSKSCTIDFGTIERPEIHRMYWHPVRIYGSGILKGMLVSTRWNLVWEGVSALDFETETELKEYILRCAYGIREQYLIPSEFLYDAGLSYFDLSVWIDSWSFVRTKEKKYDLYPGVSGVSRPVNRSICLTTLGKAATERAKAIRDYQSKRDRCRILPRREDEPRLIPVPIDWEDFAWEGRVLFPLCSAPKEQPSDEECTYNLSFPEMGATAKRRLRAHSA